MPRNPHVQVLAVANNQVQAELVARDLDVPQRELDLTEWLGEERCVIRVVPIGGQWHVQSWPASALEWEAKDAADVPFVQTEDSVAFP